MPPASTPLSRHHDYVCHLIYKLESRFGPDDECLAPLRGTVAQLRRDALQPRKLVAPRDGEKPMNVVRRFWETRKQRIALH